MLSTVLLATANRTNAGTFVNQGTSQESSGYSGGSFIPPNPITRPPQIVPGTNLELGPNGELIVTAEAQAALNQAASEITSQTAGANTISGAILVLLKGQDSFDSAKTQLQTNLVTLGASQESVQAFITSISGLLATENVNITQFNNAVNAWNNLIKQLSPQSLREFMKNQDIAKLAKDLKKLRQALKKAS
ncbi:hypothetical protein H6G35_00630 [Aulosira sp. FACHB-113]|nr:hypothetical protein [Aulosira sp. FACHB-113]